MISATIIADSISDRDLCTPVRFTTIQATYPRTIHDEIMTHRMFARCAESARAVPVITKVAEVLTDPWVPSYWGTNQKGMQAGLPVDAATETQAREIWCKLAKASALAAQDLASLKIHKQIANRLLMPYSYITTLISATEWANFFALRTDSAAEPHFQELAGKMLAAMNTSEPWILRPGEWHLPYVSYEEFCEFRQLPWREISSARCARLSYNNREGKRASLEDELDLFKRLMGNTIKHSSPTEHVATPMQYGPPFCGPFRGWQSFRSMIPGENIRTFDALLTKTGQRRAA